MIDFSLYRISGFAGVSFNDISLSIGFRWCGFDSPDYAIIQFYGSLLFIYGEMHINKF